MADSEVQCSVAWYGVVVWHGVVGMVCVCICGFAIQFGVAAIMARFMVGWGRAQRVSRYASPVACLSKYVPAVTASKTSALTSCLSAYFRHRGAGYLKQDHRAEGQHLMQRQTFPPPTHRSSGSQQLRLITERPACRQRLDAENVKTVPKF